MKDSDTNLNRGTSSRGGGEAGKCLLPRNQFQEGTLRKLKSGGPAEGGGRQELPGVISEENC